jgi:hypothetical protein
MNAHNLKSTPIDLGRGFSVESTFTAGRMDCERSPHVPTAKHGLQLLTPYRRARDTFLGQVASRTGINITVAELPAVTA